MLSGKVSKVLLQVRRAIFSADAPDAIMSGRTMYAPMIDHGEVLV